MLAQGNDPGPDGVLLRLYLRTASDISEEFTVSVLSEAPAQDTEGAGLVAEPTGRLERRKAGDEVGPERLVLALPGVLRFEEEPGFLGCNLIWCFYNEM